MYASSNPPLVTPELAGYFNSQIRKSVGELLCQRCGLKSGQMHPGGGRGG